MMTIVRGCCYGLEVWYALASRINGRGAGWSDKAERHMNGLLSGLVVVVVVVVSEKGGIMPARKQGRLIRIFYD